MQSNRMKINAISMIRLETKHLNSRNETFKKAESDFIVQDWNQFEIVKSEFVNAMSERWVQREKKWSHKNNHWKQQSEKHVNKKDDWQTMIISNDSCVKFKQENDRTRQRKK